MRYILTVLLLFTVFGCNDMASYEYRPHKGIELQIILKDAKYSQENKATFLSFDLQIQNDASENVYFDPGRLQAKVNNTISQATYHDSLASVMPERKVLKKGKNSFNLYFVLPRVKNLTAVDEFEVINFGIDKGEVSS